MNEEQYKNIFNYVASDPISDDSKEILQHNYELLGKNRQEQWGYKDYINLSCWKKYYHKNTIQYQNKMQIIPKDLQDIDSTFVYQDYMDNGRNLYHIRDFYDFLKNTDTHKKYENYEWCNENIQKLRKLDVLLRNSCQNIIVL